MRAAVLAAVLAALSPAAHATCSGDPFDMRCTQYDMLHRPGFSWSQYYLENPVARRGTIYQCSHATQPPPGWMCAAAFSANVSALSRGY